MPGSDLVASPVLVGRDELLALADRRLTQAAAGRGHLLFLAGEAGIGKTRLLASIARRAERLDFGVVRGAAFRGDAQASGGVLLDVAGHLRRSADEDIKAVGQALTERLRDPLIKEGDQHHQRRFLVQELVETLSDLDARRPLLIVLEDLHWADRLSLEVIAHLAARVSLRATLMVGAYRSDELYPDAPMREWRQRLVSQRVAEELRLPRLTPAQTGTLTSAMLGRPAAAQVVAMIQDRTDGIPLHIEELVAAAGGATAATGLEGTADVVQVPDTLADAVIARASALDPEPREIAEAATVIGRSFDFDLLVAVTQRHPNAVDRCLRQLRAAYLVEAGIEPDTFDFRHALIRDALYAEIPLPRRRELHERVALVAVDRGYREAFVSAHFDQAHFTEPAYRHSVLAAREAAAASAHREALELYRRAQRNLPDKPIPEEQAALLSALGREAAAVDENTTAATAFAEAQSVWAGAGDALSAAAVVPPLVSVMHLLGEGLETRVRRIEQALTTVPDHPDGDRVRAQLLGALAAAYLVNDGLDQAIAYGEESRALSRASGDEQAELNTAATLGSVLMFAGEVESGWALLEDAVERSVDVLHEAEAARSYRMGGTSASVLVEYDRAERWLIRGIEYAENVELWNHRSYMAAHLAHVQWARGRWQAARQTAEQALADGRGGITTRITALYVLGYLAMGSGDRDAATGLLREALELGESMGELQRISPPLWGLAETALLAQDHDAAIAYCERGYAASEPVNDAAYLFPYLVTGVRARLAQGDQPGAQRWLTKAETTVVRRGIPGTLPALDHARGLLQAAAGDAGAARTSLEAARSAWLQRGRFWEGSWATLDLARSEVRTRRHAEGIELAVGVRTSAEASGATALVTAADSVLQLDPARAAKPWHPLTAREFAVARLVADGMTNREIAAQLVLSPKTVSAHVEHILTKLGAGRRAEIAAWAARIEPGP